MSRGGESKGGGCTSHTRKEQKVELALQHKGGDGRGGDSGHPTPPPGDQVKPVLVRYSASKSPGRGERAGEGLRVKQEQDGRTKIKGLDSPELDCQRLRRPGPSRRR